MAKVVVISDKKFSELHELLGGSKTTVIIKESVAKKHGIKNGDDRFNVYTCGDDPDVWVDFVSDDTHFAISSILEEGSE